MRFFKHCHLDAVSRTRNCFINQLWVGINNRIRYPLKSMTSGKSVVIYLRFKTGFAIGFLIESIVVSNLGKASFLFFHTTFRLLLQ
jgi:hypothetical protein